VFRSSRRNRLRVNARGFDSRRDCAFSNVIDNNVERDDSGVDAHANQLAAR